VIKVQGLSKVFGDPKSDKAVKAVDDVTFEVEKGEIFAFLGPNGAGKTTTIQMLTTLLRPTGGRIAIDGLDPVAQPLEVRKRFGIVFQDPSLDQELTAYENMDLHGVLYHVPRKVRAERIEALLKLFELWERRTSFVKTFSGGMRRRLEIARSLIHQPEVLFLDEPTTGLDPASRHAMWAMIRELQHSSGVTLFLTTHYMEEADELCDLIAICDHGRIVASGTPAELKREAGCLTLEDVFIAYTGRGLRDAAEGDGRLDVRHFYDRGAR
jgi:ABC-2 type transport system ATP-binding protein